MQTANTTVKPIESEKMTNHFNDQKNPGQQMNLVGDVPEIVKNETEDIATRSQVGNVRGHHRNAVPHYVCMQTDSWAADMYDICGGDGEGNAYLGDGLSITPDGQITDD